MKDYGKPFSMNAIQEDMYGMGRPTHHNWNLYSYTTADWNHPTMLSRVVGDQIHVEYTDLLPRMDMYGRISGGGLQQQDLCGHSTTVIICSPTGGQVNVAPSCMSEITGDGGCWQVYDYGWMAHSSGYRPHYIQIGIKLSRKGGAIFHWYAHNDRNVWPGYPNVVESMPGYGAVGMFSPTNSFPKQLSSGASALTGASLSNMLVVSPEPFYSSVSGYVAPLPPTPNTILQRIKDNRLSLVVTDLSMEFMEYLTQAYTIHGGPTLLSGMRTGATLLGDQ